MFDAMGTLAEDGDRRSVRFERRFDATPEEVWNALVEPERLRRWLAEAIVDAREGGSVELRFTDDSGGHVTGAIRVYDPPRVLEYDWTYEGEPGSVLRFELRATEGGTELVLEHRLLSPESGPGYAAGWHAHLDALAAALADEPAPDWQRRYEELRPDYVALGG
jgi:uncharacterized protein YndB with AHSA1/START domain